MLDFEIILRDGLKQDACKHIKQFAIDEKISKPLFDEFYKLMKSKPKTKGGKKGGKKKWQTIKLFILNIKIFFLQSIWMISDKKCFLS